MRNIQRQHEKSIPTVCRDACMCVIVSAYCNFVCHVACTDQVDARREADDSGAVS